MKKKRILEGVSSFYGRDCENFTPSQQEGIIIFSQDKGSFLFSTLLGKIYAGRTKMLIKFNEFGHGLLHLCCKPPEILSLLVQVNWNCKHGVQSHISCTASVSKSLHRCSKIALLSTSAYWKKTWIFFFKPNIG